MLLSSSFEDLKFEKFLVPLLVLSELCKGATFHLFVLSLQTPMYENEDNKRISNGSPQNLIGNRPISAPMYEENPTLLYPQVHLMNNPIAIGSNFNERQKVESNVLNQTGNAPNTLYTKVPTAITVLEMLQILLLLKILLVLQVTIVMKMLHYPHHNVYKKNVYSLVKFLLLKSDKASWNRYHCDY